MGQDSGCQVTVLNDFCRPVKSCRGAGHMVRRAFRHGDPAWALLCCCYDRMEKSA